jgi:TP901 family phage tail tape measure protein
MGVAFNMSANEAGQAIAQMMNVYNLSLSRVRELADAVNVLGNTMATNEAAIVEVMTRVGGSAKQFGLTAEQTAALAAAFTSLGKSPMVAATAINALLSKLQTANVQGAEFQAALAQIGLSGDKLARDIRENPQAALEEFLKTLQRLDGQQRAELSVKLFGQEYHDDISLLVGSLGQYEAALGRVADKTQTAGALEREFAERAKTTEAQLTLLKNAVTVLAANIGSTFLPVIAGAANVTTTLTRAMSDFASQNPGLTAMSTTLASIAVSLTGLKLATSALNVVWARSFAAMRAEVALLNASLGQSIKQVGLLSTALRGAFMALAGWGIGQMIGGWLRQFALVRIAVNTLIAGFMSLGEWIKSVQYIATHWENPLKELERLYDRLKQIRDEWIEINKWEWNRDFGSEQEAAQAAAPPAGNNPAAAPETGSDPAAKAVDQTTQSLSAARDAIKELGGDVSRFANTTSKEFVQVAGHLDVIIKETERLSAAGVDTAAVLEDAFSKAIDSAETQAEIN